MVTHHTGQRKRTGFTQNAEASQTDAQASKNNGGLLAGKNGETYFLFVLQLFTDRKCDTLKYAITICPYNGNTFKSPDSQIYPNLYFYVMLFVL